MCPYPNLDDLDLQLVLNYFVPIVFQALGATTESDLTSRWNRSSAVNYIVSRQAPDGSFGDVFTTTEVVLALGPRHFSSIRDLNCGNTAGNFTANGCNTFLICTIIPVMLNYARPVQKAV